MQDLDLDAREREAIAKIQALLDDKELWFEMEVAALELNDKLDDLNDSIRNLQAAMVERGIRPGWIPNNEGALLWNGKEFLVEEPGKRPLRWLDASKGIRLKYRNLTELGEYLIKDQEERGGRSLAPGLVGRFPASRPRRRTD